jgi:hypothetical protein
VQNHSEIPIDFRLREKLAPTRQRVPGALTSSDRGEGTFGIANDPESRRVILDFESPVTWVGFDYDHAMALADLLIQHANALRGIT